MVLGGEVDAGEYPCWFLAKYMLIFLSVGL